MLVMILSCFGSYINPQNSSFLSFLALTFPIWAFLTFLFLIYWVLVNPKYIYLSFIGLICCINSINNLVAIDFSKKIEATSKIKIVSFNFANSSLLHNKKSKQKTEKNISLFKRDFRKINADVYCIQECNIRSRNILNELFGDYESHFFHFKDGTAIYSRYPIKNTGKIDFGFVTNSGIYVDIEIKGKTTRVYNIHLKSNQITKSEIAEIRDINNDYDKNLEDTKGVLSKYGKENLQRVKQMKQVLKEISKSPYPVILCGDFNEPPQSYVYKETVKKLQDSFREKGMGIGGTYAGKIPFLRIDYIFSDRNYTVVEYQKLTFPWSDHYPIISTIGINVKQ